MQRLTSAEGEHSGRQVHLSRSGTVEMTGSRIDAPQSVRPRKKAECQSGPVVLQELAILICMIEYKGERIEKSQIKTGYKTPPDVTCPSFSFTPSSIRLSSFSGIGLVLCISCTQFSSETPHSFLPHSFAKMSHIHQPRNHIRHANRAGGFGGFNGGGQTDSFTGGGFTAGGFTVGGVTFPGLGMRSPEVIVYFSPNSRPNPKDYPRNTHIDRACCFVSFRGPCELSLGRPDSQLCFTLGP